MSSLPATSASPASPPVMPPPARGAPGGRGPGSGPGGAEGDAGHDGPAAPLQCDDCGRFIPALDAHGVAQCR
eukprot:1410771-Alexandrium_andersonii.AAC.1